jgi:putative transposase
MSRFAPQQIRTFFVTSVTWGRRSVFQTARSADLFLQNLIANLDKGRFQLHAFVLMPDHFHLLITPAAEISLEKALQFVKGGFSFRAKKEGLYSGEIWQPGFTEHRVKDAADFLVHVQYIHENPVRARLVESPEDYSHSSANGRFETDQMPEHLRG